MDISFTRLCHGSSLLDADTPDNSQGTNTLHRNQQNACSVNHGCQTRQGLRAWAPWRVGWRALRWYTQLFTFRKGRAESGLFAAHDHAGITMRGAAGTAGTGIEPNMLRAAAEAGRVWGGSLIGGECLEASGRGLVGNGEAGGTRLLDGGLVKLAIGCWK